MQNRSGPRQKVQDETLELKNRLEEAEETLRAIRQYMVDAFVVAREDGNQIVTLSDTDFLYRKMVEAMNEGAVTLIADGTIFYCNPSFGRIVNLEHEKLIGIPFGTFLPAEQRPRFEQIFNQADMDGIRGDFLLQTVQGEPRPVQLSVTRLGTELTSGTAIIITDISERLQSEEKIRQLASELTIAEQEERHRISQVLHDDLQQRLFAIKSQLAFLRVSGNPDELAADLDQVENWLADAITITRNLSVDMSPAVLRGEGLAEAFLWLSKRMKEQYGLQLTINASSNLGNLDNHMRVLLFQAVRELLFNVVKHSGTNAAVIAIEHTNNQGHITVSDAGRGFDTKVLANDPSSVHGLLLIKDRLSLMRGTMSIHSVPGDGTRVEIEFPLEESSPK